MTNTELIRQEVERRLLEDYNSGDTEIDEVAQGVCAALLYFIDSLPKETPTPEEAMSILDEKIKSAKKSWEGVDADEYLDEVRGGDETVTDCHQLEEELDAFIKSGKAIKEENCGTYTTTYIDPLKLARHFAKWGAEHLIDGNKVIGDHIADDSKKVSGDSINSNDLEEAAEDCAEHIDEYGDPYPAMIDAFKAGAEWQKKQNKETI